MTSVEPWGEFAHDPRSPTHASLRASDADRDVVLRVLGTAYADGRLDVDEFDERTSGVQAARTLGELPVFLSDLVAHADDVSHVAAGPALSDQQVEAQAVERWRKSRGEALRLWLFVSTICWTIWLLTNNNAHPWPIYPMLGTAVPLLGTLVQRRDMIESNRRKIIAQHEKAAAKAIAKAEKKRAQLEPPP